MIGDKYKVKQDCQTGRFRLKQGDVLIENGAYNFETEEELREVMEEVCIYQHQEQPNEDYYECINDYLDGNMNT